MTTLEQIDINNSTLPNTEKTRLLNELEKNQVVPVTSLEFCDRLWNIFAFITLSTLTIMFSMLFIFAYIDQPMMNQRKQQEQSLYRIFSSDSFCNTTNNDTYDSDFCLYSNEFQQLIGMYREAMKVMGYDFPGLSRLMYRTTNLYLIHSYKLEKDIQLILKSLNITSK